MKDVPEFCPKDKNDWRKWLELNHQKQDAIWLIFYKKNSAKFNLSWSESVDEALCFGWIDSTKKSIDDERFKQYFCKRKPKSNWSKVNKEKVKNLIENGLMQNQGYKSIEIAKENGYWTFLDDVENLVIPEDLKKALLQHPDAMSYFETLSNSVKKGLLYWVISAKRKETRKKRIQEMVEQATKQMLPKNLR